MINIREVQINNVYGFKDVESYPRVFQVNNFNFTSLSEFPQDYRGIEIDDEMLLRNRFFVKGGGAYVNIEHHIEVMHGDDGFEVYFKGLYITKVSWLHQLQNIIRALTKEEIILI